MLADKIYLLDIYYLVACVLSIVVIFKCIKSEKTKIKKILWSLFILFSVPFFMIGAVLYTLIYWQNWFKFVPLVISVFFNILIPFVAIDWFKNAVQTLDRENTYNEIIQEKVKNIIARENNPELYQWGIDAALLSLNLNHNTYKENFYNSKELFTEDGYKSYSLALDKAYLPAALAGKEINVIFELDNSRDLKAYAISSTNITEDLVINIPGYLTYEYPQKRDKKTMKVLVTFFVRSSDIGFKATHIVVSPSSDENL